MGRLKKTAMPSPVGVCVDVTEAVDVVIASRVDETEQLPAELPENDDEKETLDDVLPAQVPVIVGVTESL